MALTLDTTKEGERTTVKAVGEIDVSNASDLRAGIDQALEDGPAAFVVDISEVPYIDSTGIGVLVGAAHRAQEGKTAFAVANPQANVARVLSLLGVDRELGVAETN